MIGQHRGVEGNISVVPSLLKELLTVEIPSFLLDYLNKQVKEKKLKANEQDKEKFHKVCQHLEDFLSRITPLHGDSYPHLFYNLMKELSQHNEKDKWKFFNQKNRNIYYQLLSIYILKEKHPKFSEIDNDKSQEASHKDSFLCSTSPNERGNFFNRLTVVDTKKCTHEAKELMQFIERYQQDPFSSVIGKKPSDPIIKSAILNQEAFIPIQREILIVNLIQTDARPKRNNSLTSSSKSQGLRQSIKKITKKPKSGSLLQRCASLEDLSDYRFVRFLNQNEDNSVNVQLSIEDNFIYSFTQYYRIPAALAEITLTGSPESLRQFINNPIDKLFDVISDLAQSKLVKYLQSDKDFDYNLFERMELYQYHNQPIQEYWNIQRNETLLQSLFPLIPEEFRSELAVMSNEVATQFIDEKKLFLPTLNKEIALINSFPNDALNNCIKSTLGKYQSALQNIKNQIKEVLSSERKNSLVKWWLIEIRNQVKTFLESKNYIPNAIPENYLEVPPPSMDDVKSNLDTLKKIFDTQNYPSYSPSTMIEELKELVYPKIEQLISDIKYSIIIEIGEPEGEYTIEELRVKFNELKDNLPEQLSKTLCDCFKDLDYLFEMMKLEDLEYARTAKSMHIVPISGLAFSQLLRLENECRTVLEYWSFKTDESGGRKRSGNVLSNNNLSAVKFKRVISVGNLQEFQEMLDLSKSEDRTTALMELDENGWNIFHLCAAKENLSMCNLLLDENLDVNIQNCDGNSPLHFLVRVKQPNLEDLLLEIIKKYIAKGGKVSVVNKYRETPLHCCFRGFASVGKLLLEHKADPNALTLREETPLHYAVKSENLDMIRALLNKGADPFIGDSIGNTPLSLAIRFKNPIAESLLNMKLKEIHRKVLIEEINQ